MVIIKRTTCTRLMTPSCGVLIYRPIACVKLPTRHLTKYLVCCLYILSVLEWLWQKSWSRLFWTILRSRRFTIIIYHNYSWLWKHCIYWILIIKLIHLCCTLVQFSTAVNLHIAHPPVYTICLFIFLIFKHNIYYWALTSIYIYIFSISLLTFYYCCCTKAPNQILRFFSLF